MKAALKSNGNTGAMRSESICLEDANSFKGFLTRELFTEAEVKNNFNGDLLRSLFLNDLSSSAGE